VVFDQRGCGRSRPLADTAAADLTTNTTQHLIGDIELLRAHLGIERWVVTGASWGVTLALAYAQRHPERVVAMVLAAVTSGTRRETDWITRDMRRVFPREWDEYAGGVPESERDGDLCAAYARLLADPDPAVTDRAARMWCTWEDVHVSLAPGAAPSPRYADPTFRQVFAGSSRTTGATAASSTTRRSCRRWGGSPAFRPCSSTAGTTCPDRSTPPGTCTTRGRTAGSWSARTPATAESP
jgi:proline iminopeptidase